MKKLLTLILSCIALFTAVASKPSSQYLATNGSVVESVSGVTLKAGDKERYSWCSVDPRSIGLRLDNAQNIVAEVTNSGSCSVDVLLWAVGGDGWNCSAGSATIAKGESKNVLCNLRATFSDGTPKLDPTKISRIEIMILKPQVGAEITIKEIQGEGIAEKFKATKERVLIPEVSNDKPSAGERVRYKLSEDSDIYGVLYLPEDWRKGSSYPMIVEFPGNIFYTASCYSTGLPDQCTIGYGVSKGKGVILLSLPFVDYRSGKIATSGWGRPDDTADYAVKMVEKICDTYGADKERIMLTGFSRGAIACGFIGLRNPKIASLWRAIHCCQHFDGDGWGGSRYEDAVLRLQNGLTTPQFHTDNTAPKLKEMLSNAKINATYVNSGLGAHACDMFLDERPSTEQLREWFWSTMNE